MADGLGIAGLGICSGALLFAIVAVAVNTWVSREVGSVEFTIGLWKSCTDGECDDLDEDSAESNVVDAYKAVRAMIIIAIIFLPGAIVCVALKMMVMKENDMLTLIGGVVAGVAGLCLMIAMAVYHAELYEPEYKDMDYDLSIGFALDIVAWILAWVGAGLILAKKFIVK